MARAAAIFALFVALLAAGAVFAQSVQPVHAIRSKTVLTADDLTLVEESVPGAIDSIEAAVGQEAKIALYPGRPILLVVDNASIHTATIVAAWLADHPRLALLWLPAYSGHRQNPVEKVWWRLKGHVAANRLYGNIESLVAATHDFFASFTPEAARQLAA